MDCSTIIVSYNTYALTEAAVRAMLGSTGDVEHEVIVVDNASPDESERRLRSAFADDARVTVLASGGNVGFSKANNVGARVARGRMLFFLNPDTVAHPDAVQRLVAFADSTPDAGAIGPKVTNPDGSLQPSAMRFPHMRALACHRFPFLTLFGCRPPPLDAPSVVDVVNGCALMLSRETFDAVGGWDERYFMYSEETELCRSTAELGRRTYFVPHAQIMHYGGQAGLDQYAEQQVLMAQSELAYLGRHGGAMLRGFARASGVAGFAARALAFGVLGAARTGRRADYQRRSKAASALWRYYLNPKGSV